MAWPGRARNHILPAPPPDRIQILAPTLPMLWDIVRDGAALEPDKAILEYDMTLEIGQERHRCPAGKPVPGEEWPGSSGACINSPVARRHRISPVSAAGPQDGYVNPRPAWTTARDDFVARSRDVNAHLVQIPATVPLLPRRRRGRAGPAGCAARRAPSDAAPAAGAGQGQPGRAISGLPPMGRGSAPGPSGRPCRRCPACGIRTQVPWRRAPGPGPGSSARLCCAAKEW